MPRRSVPLLLALFAIALSSGCAKRGSDAPMNDAPHTLSSASFLTLPGQHWKLLWHDEFTGEALDTSKWRIGLPWKGSDGDGRHHDNRYLSYTVDHNVVVDDGVLKLFTRREEATARNLRKFQYTQGLITTAHAFRHRYGYWEARVKIPVAAGPGLWPAFWTLAEGWPPEMDICEVWTSTSRLHQGMAYRAAADGKQMWDHTTSHAPLPRDWTTFGMEWGPGYQVYNVNGRVTKRIYGDHVTDDAHYVLLNSGVEARHPPTEATVFPNAFEVDYVRIYERPDVPALLNGDFEGGNGFLPWKVAGPAGRSASDGRRGPAALRLSGGSVASQKVYGLKPATTYVLRSYAKVRDGHAQLGVSGHGGEDQIVARALPNKRAATYEPLSIEFTTGPDATTAVVTCSAPSGDADVLLDDVSLRAK